MNNLSLMDIDHEREARLLRKEELEAEVGRIEKLELEETHQAGRYRAYVNELQQRAARESTALMAKEIHVLSRDTHKIAVRTFWIAVLGIFLALVGIAIAYFAWQNPTQTTISI